jgi:hypothetical protein
MRRFLRTLAFAALLAGWGSAASAATIMVGTAITISPTEFALPIEVTGAVQLSEWQFSLAYDPSDVLVDTDCDPVVDTFCGFITGFTTEGDFFAAGSPFNVLNPGFVELDPTLSTQLGTLSAVQGAYGGVPPAPSGDGVIAYVRFLIVGDGDSPITVIDSSVTEVPEPASVLLLTIGLPAVGLRRLITRRGRRR